MAGYEPLNTLKPIGKDIWIVDGPLIRFYGIAFSTRMTVVRLQNGEVWLHSPTKICDALKAEIAALGPVRHLIAPNWIHYAYINEWKTAFSSAHAYAAPGVQARAKKHGVNIRFDETLSQTAPDPWAGQIKQMIVEGSKVHREAVFFHDASKTLILTDLIENFEAKNLSWLMRHLTRWGGIQDPDGQMPRDMRMTFSRGLKKLRAAVEQMIDWGPERVILAHGRWYDRDAVAELKRAFRWVL